MNTTDLDKDILIAEDDAEDVLLFKTALDDINVPYDVRHAENGDALFILLKDKIPYILFLDIHMPCKDGMTCILEIRRNREYDQLPVIIYSSHVANNFIETSFRNGANFYLRKPHTFRELTEKLKKIFAIDWANHIHYPSQDHFKL